MEEIFREECARVAAQRVTWLDFKEAAAYLAGMSLRTFERRKAEWGLPVSELSARLKMVYRADLDALGLTRLVKGARPLCAKCGEQVVIEFPSVAAMERLTNPPSHEATARQGRSVA
jgi:hypothetical protein